jgi:hypothetical protein
MKNRNVVIYLVLSALALSFMTVGCDQQVSKKTSTSVSSDGTVKSQEKTVTESADGTVTEILESKTTEPKSK